MPIKIKNGASYKKFPVQSYYFVEFYEISVKKSVKMLISRPWSKANRT
jgi:hypothetical protein